MSSCRATTSMSRDTEPSAGVKFVTPGAGGGAPVTAEVGVSCAEAAAGSKSVAIKDGRIVETGRAPERSRFVIKFLAWMARHSGPAALGQVDETDLKREAGLGNERGGKTGEAPKPSRAPQAAAVQTWTQALLRSRPGWRCGDRAQSRPGNRRPSEQVTGGQLVGRPRKRPARLARKVAESDGANRRGAPETGSQRRRAARPRGAEPAASVHWSKSPSQSSNARQTISLGRGRSQ